MKDAVLAGFQKLPAEKKQQLRNLLNEAHNEPVAIIGMACRFPGNVVDTRSFWQMLEKGRSSDTDIPADRWPVARYFDADPKASAKMYTKRGSYLKDITSFDSEFFGLSPRESHRLDPQQRLLMHTSWELFENAGLNVQTLAGSDVGVYVGIVDNQFAMRQSQGHWETAIDDPYYGIGSASSVAAGRLAHFYNFQGPAMAVDTACSSSLVALHLACQSLRSNDCSLALVAGVNVITLPGSIIQLCKMNMLAKDGRCKTFDASADGFAVGEGCGMVLIKPLSRAIADQDLIYALIHATAVNEDGRSGNLTAPNGLAQQNVMRQTLNQCNLDPGLVGYVEAHGSGTALGDPIEMDSINQVYARNRNPETPLFVGTVKTNIGHLAAGAGLAGLIKTALALQHKKIPAHLHLKDLNPHIRLGGVEVPRSTRDWRAIDGRFLAGVSSFGWSGTNAHAVLEAFQGEAVQNADGCEGDPGYTMIPYAAKSEQAMRTKSQQLESLLRQPDTELDRLACSMAMSVGDFDNRAVLLGNSKEQCLHNLISGDVKGLLHQNGVIERGVTFLFPGLGDQYPGMAAELYQTEPVVKEIIDQAIAVLHGIRPIDWGRILLSNKPTNSGQIDRTEIAQPCLFIFEYALARLWMSWGLVPRALAGYSLGEYVAACVSGVLSFTDGLRLVMRRAELIAGLPAGAMLAILAPEAEVRERIDKLPVWISAINGPMMTVIAGAPEDIENCRQIFVDASIAAQRVRATHAFHTPLMMEIADDFKQVLGCVRMQQPTIPYVSNIDGEWVQNGAVTDAQYWLDHLVKPVNFNRSLDTLWQRENQILLEVGIGQTLTSLAFQHPRRRQAKSAKIIYSLPSKKDLHTQDERLVKARAELWLAGARLDWRAVWGDTGKQRMPVPGYPFDYKDFPLDDLLPENNLNRHQASTKIPYRDWFYLPQWKSQPLHKFVQGALESWLIMLDHAGFGQLLASILRRDGHRVITVAETRADGQEADYQYKRDTAADDFHRLFGQLQGSETWPRHVVYLGGVGESPEIDRQQTFDTVVMLVQALGRLCDGKQPMNLWLVSNQAYDVLGNEPVNAMKSLLLGPSKVVGKEYEFVTSAHVDIDRIDERTAQLLALECCHPCGHDVIALRNHRRWVRLFEAVDMADQGQTKLRRNGVYLITGGSGGIGMSLALALVEKYQAKVALVSRHVQNPVTGEVENENARQKRRMRERLKALVRQGASVMYLEADVTDAVVLARVVENIEVAWGRLHGVFHAAGLPGEGLIQQKTAAQAAAVLNPKVDGTLALEKCLAQKPLDFLMLFSSSNAVTGGFGEVDYCAANAFLDAFAQANPFSFPVYAVNWGPWQWDAWQTTLLAQFPALHEQVQWIRTEFGIRFDEGFQVIEDVLAHDHRQVLILAQGLQAALVQWGDMRLSALLQTVKKGIGLGKVQPRPQLQHPYIAPAGEIEEKIAAVWRHMLCLEQVGVEDHFFELGGNSLLSMAIVAELEKIFARTIPAALLYEGPTVRDLAKLLSEDDGTEQEQQLMKQRGARRRTMQQQRLARARVAAADSSVSKSS